MKFATLASCFERLNVTSSRNDMTALLARLLAGASPDEIGIVCYFTLGAIAPGYSGVTPGIGERTAAAAIALAAGVDPAVVEAAARELGDYGDAAARLTVAPPEGPTGPLTVTDVHRGFMEITRASGPGSADRKTRVLAAMLAAATPPERRYLVRLATGEMRLGAGDMTLLDALAEAFLGSKAERPPLEHAYNISSDIGLVARTLQESGLAGVSAIPVTLHRPIRPMLTQRVSRISEIPERIGSPVIAVEEKYDGERVQAHKDGDDVTLFSRRLTDVTHQYPDIVRHIRRCVTADTAILDGEAVAFDHETGTYRPFQTLMRRRRKHRVREVAGEIPATYRVFDLLYVNGESYLRRSYPDRRARLEEVLSPDEKISPADRTLTGDLDGITEFYLCGVEGAEREGSLRKGGGDSRRPFFTFTLHRYSLCRRRVNMTLSYAAEVPVPALSDEGSGGSDRQAPRVLPVCVQLGPQPQEHSVPRRGDQPLQVRPHAAAPGAQRRVAVAERGQRPVATAIDPSPLPCVHELLRGSGRRTDLQEEARPRTGVHGAAGVYRGLPAGHRETPEDRNAQSQVPSHLRGHDEVCNRHPQVHGSVPDQHCGRRRQESPEADRSDPGSDGRDRPGSLALCRPLDRGEGGESEVSQERPSAVGRAPAPTRPQAEGVEEPEQSPAQGGPVSPEDCRSTKGLPAPALFSTGPRKPSTGHGVPERGRHGEEPLSRESDQRCWVGHVPFDAGVQVPGGREVPAEDRGLRAVFQDLLGLRLPEGRPDTEGSGVDMSGLRHDPRPGPERRDQYQTIRISRRGTRRRACGPAPDGEGDEAGSPLRKRGVVHLACIERGLEGVVCKSCAEDSFYRAGAREWQWIKWKSDYGTELADTLDLVVVGANAGRGKRAGTYGSVLCAAYNHEEDIFQTVCGMGTGFTDADLADLPRRLAGVRVDRQPTRVMVTPQAVPDFWFAPTLVVEVLGLEITESPVHTCNWDPERRRGLALRFPRFVRWRDEKNPEAATTTAEVAAMFRRRREG